MSSDERCRGCHVYGRCFIEPRIKNGFCPCTICIVKPICRVVCVSQMEYSQLYLRYFRSLEYKKMKAVTKSEFYGDIAELTRHRIIAQDALLRRIIEQGPKIDLSDYQKYYLSILENKKAVKRKGRHGRKRIKKRQNL